MSSSIPGEGFFEDMDEAQAIYRLHRHRFLIFDTDLCRPDLVDAEELHASNEEYPEATTASSSDPFRVPLTILTGALGAGKSSLIDYILRAQHDHRIAVIINEFGDTGDIDSKSMTVASNGALYDEILELNNGCLCCSIRDEGKRALENLMARKGAFDHILLETTGLADPVPIASSIWLDDVSEQIYLNGVVTVVDSLNALQQLEEAGRSPGQGEEVIKQIATADAILLSKQDLVDQAQVETVKSAVVQINSVASIQKVERGQTDLSAILELDSYYSGTKPFDPKSLGTPSPAPIEKSQHLSKISTLTIPVPPLKADAKTGTFDAVIRDLLWEGSVGEGTAKAEVLRCKGLVKHVDGRCWVISGVREVYDIREVPSADDVTPRLVLIGRNLDSNLRDRIAHTLSVA